MKAQLSRNTTGLGLQWEELGEEYVRGKTPSGDDGKVTVCHRRGRAEVKVTYHRSLKVSDLFS